MLNDATAITEASPHDVVLANFKLPFPLRPYQIKDLNELAPKTRAGYYYEQGTGKTVTATAATLYKLASGRIDACIVIMPPILLTMWFRWLNKIEGVTVVKYAGTPTERTLINLDAKFVLMSIQIFKRDQEYLERVFRNKRLNILVDEAHSIKNVSSANYKSLRDFSAGHDMMLLSGTPISTPMDGYAFCKFITPDTYRSMGQFVNLHVDKVDFFKKVTAWKNLDVLTENMKINSTRVLRQEVLEDLPPVIYTPLFYSLESKHQKLYDMMAEEQILKLEGGKKIDATSAQAMYFALQQIVTNYEQFSGVESDVSNAFEMVDQVIDEMGGAKLVIFATYRMTNRTLLKRLAKHNAVAAFGDNTTKQNQKSLETFMDDPKCKIFIGQPTSVGYGVDGLQHVCKDALFLETPTVPRDFHQAVARLYRGGQTDSTTIRIAVAEKTIQVRLHDNLLINDKLVNRVIGSFEDLRDAIYGK